MPHPIAVPPHETWAEVRAHDQVMRYRRSGAGRAVLVLRSAHEADPIWPELSASLAARFRLIVPDVPINGGDVAAWLADFLEGLGVPSIAVLAAEQLCLPALELALLDADQVARVALVLSGDGGETGLDGVLAARARELSVPSLVVRGSLPVVEALPLVTGFLAGDAVGEVMGSGAA